MSGGGTSGKVDFPEHMKELHKDWMGYASSGADTPVDTDLIQVMNTALGTSGNPWDVTLTDPSTDLGEVDTRYDAYETEVNALDEQADWTSIIDNAVTKIDSAGVLKDVDVDTIATAARTGATNGVSDAIESAVDAIDGNIIRNAVVNYQRRANIQKERNINRFSATMADINAVNSSAYMFGLAIIEAQHLQDVDQFQSQLEVQTYDRMIQNYVQFFQSELQSRLRADLIEKQSRDRLLSEATQIMVQMLSSRIQSYSDSVAKLAETKRIKTVATQEHELADADLNYKFSQWDFEVFQHASNVLGSISGAAAKMPAQPSTVGSVLGGAMGGASAGAAFGPVGAGVGAVLGGASALV